MVTHSARLVRMGRSSGASVFSLGRSHSTALYAVLSTPAWLLRGPGGEVAAHGAFCRKSLDAFRLSLATLLPTPAGVPLLWSSHPLSVWELPARLSLSRGSARMAR